MPGPLRSESAPEATVELVVRIGAVDDPDYALTSLRSLDVGSDETVYTLHRMGLGVRMFNADGMFVRTVGRPGAGPGEFQAAIASGLVGDTLWVWDRRAYRFSQFSG